MPPFDTPPLSLYCSVERPPPLLLPPCHRLPTHSSPRPPQPNCLAVAFPRHGCLSSAWAAASSSRLLPVSCHPSLHPLAPSSPTVSTLFESPLPLLAVDPPPLPDISLPSSTSPFIGSPPSSLLLLPHRLRPSSPLRRNQAILTIGARQIRPSIQKLQIIYIRPDIQRVIFVPKLHSFLLGCRPCVFRASCKIEDGISRDPVTGEELDRVEFYRNMRWKQTKGWIAHEVKQNYEKTVKICSYVVEGGKEFTDGDIVENVLGKRFGYIIGLGHAEVPPSGKAKLMYNMNEVNHRGRGQRSKSSISWMLGRHPQKSRVILSNK